MRVVKASLLISAHGSDESDSPCYSSWTVMYQPVVPQPLAAKVKASRLVGMRISGKLRKLEVVPQISLENRLSDPATGHTEKIVGMLLLQHFSHLLYDTNQCQFILLLGNTLYFTKKSCHCRSFIVINEIKIHIKLTNPTNLKCQIQWFLVYAQRCAIITSILEHFYHSKKKPLYLLAVTSKFSLSFYCLVTINLLCLHGFASSGYFKQSHRI